MLPDNFHSVTHVRLRPPESPAPATPAAGLNAQLNAVPFGIIVVVAIVLLWLAAWKFAGRTPSSSDKSPSTPLALLPIGVASLMAGCWQWNQSVIQTLAAPLNPGGKAHSFVGGLAFANEHLRPFARVSHWTILGLACLIALLIVSDDRGKPPVRLFADRRALLGYLLLSLGSLAGAAALMRSISIAGRERPSLAPLPSGDILRVVDPVTPDLEGPDAIRKGPLIMIFAHGRLAVDGYLKPLDGVSDALWTMRRQYERFQSNQPFPGRVVIVADAQSSIEALESVLGTVESAGYEHTMFAFTRSVYAFARRVMELRRQGQTVILSLRK